MRDAKAKSEIDRMYQEPEFFGTTERIEVAPEDVGQALLYYEAWDGDRKTRVPIGLVYCEHNEDSTGLNVMTELGPQRPHPTKDAANVALLANAYRVLTAAVAVLREGFALCDRLAAPSIVVTTADGTELERGDVLGPLESALRDLDRKVDESCDVGWLP